MVWGSAQELQNFQKECDLGECMKPVQCFKCTKQRILIIWVIATIKTIRYILQVSIIILSNCIGNYLSHYWISRNRIYENKVNKFEVDKYSTKWRLFCNTACPTLYAYLFWRTLHVPFPILISILVFTKTWRWRWKKQQKEYHGQQKGQLKSPRWTVEPEGTWEIINLTSWTCISESLVFEGQSDSSKARKINVIADIRT